MQLANKRMDFCFQLVNAHLGQTKMYIIVHNLHYQSQSFLFKIYQFALISYRILLLSYTFLFFSFQFSSKDCKREK